MYEFHWLAEPFWPGTSWAIAKPRSAAGSPCSGALFWSVSSNLTTGGPLIVTLVILPVIEVAVLIFSADPVLVGPGGPVVPEAPAAPAGPVVPLQAVRSTLNRLAPRALAIDPPRSDARFNDDMRQLSLGLRRSEETLERTRHHS